MQSGHHSAYARTQHRWPMGAVMVVAGSVYAAQPSSRVGRELGGSHLSSPYSLPRDLRRSPCCLRHLSGGARQIAAVLAMPPASGSPEIFMLFEASLRWRALRWRELRGSWLLSRPRKDPHSGQVLALFISAHRLHDLRVAVGMQQRHAQRAGCDHALVTPKKEAGHGERQPCDEVGNLGPRRRCSADLL